MGVVVTPQEYRKSYTNMTALIYGPIGCGKTIQAYSISKFGPTRVFDMQKGAISAIVGGSRYINEQNLDIVQIRSMDDFNLEAERLQQDQDKIRFVVFDGMTDLNDLIEYEFMTSNPTRMDNDYYREKIFRMMQITRFFASSKFDIIMTANDDIAKDGRVIPMLDGKLRGLLPNKIGLVAYMSIKDDGRGNVLRQICTQSAQIAARDRFARLAWTETLGSDPAALWAKYLGIPIPAIQNGEAVVPPSQPQAPVGK